MRRQVQRFKNVLFDEETGVFRSDIFDLWLDWEIKRGFRYQNFVSLVMLEPDQPFHDKKSLKDLVSLVKKNVKDTDIIGRLDSQRFGIILLLADLDGAYVMSERLLEDVNEYVFEREPSKRIKISIGGACFPTNGIDKRVLLEKAEDMLKQAKQNGQKICLPHI
jgi:two-component system cell cycle response regulator